MTNRDFLYQRRVVAFRPFVSDQGLPGLHLTYENDDSASIVFSASMLDPLKEALAVLQASPLVKR